MEHIRIEIDRVKKDFVAPGEKLNILLTQKNSSPIITGVYMAELIRRPELDYFVLAPFDPNRPDLSVEISSQVNIQIKYEGYINRQLLHVEQFKKAENKILPEDLDYLSINGLRIEARQKLAAIRPINFGQASRITGVSPADLSVLAVYLTARNI
jgi:tRNA uridine 5-carboxymethylaminomethyl modification enzyme